MRNLDLNESWRVATSGYLPRIESALMLEPSLETILRENWLRKYFPGPEVNKAPNLAIRVSAYANALFSVSFQSFPEIRSLWSNGQFVLIPLVVRYIYECWGAIHYAKKTLNSIISEEDIEEDEARVNRLNFGARSNVQLFDGQNATEKSINVLTFIKGLTDVEDSEDAYGFLSEACHPNMVQSTYFQLAGPPLANWENEQFNGHGHKLLSKTVTIIESTSAGIQRDLYAIHVSAQKYVENNG